MEQARIVLAVGVQVEFLDLVVAIAADGSGALQPAIAFQIAIFGDAQEDDAVDGALHQMVEFALAERPVDEARLLVDIRRQVDAPDFHVAQEGRVNAQNAFGGRFEDVPVPAFAHRFGRQRFPQPIPFVEVLRTGQIHDPGFVGEIALLRLDAAIIDRELGEIGPKRQARYRPTSHRSATARWLD